jgi:preprotein translocase subunit SecF
LGKGVVFLELEHFYTGQKYKLYMAIPAILFIAFLLMVFVWPTVPAGIDLKGGTLIIIRSETPIDAIELKQLLSDNFDLVDLKVNSVSSASSSGVNIQFAGNSILIAAKSGIDSAKAMLAANPAAALQEAQAVANMLAPFVQETALPSDPEAAVAQADFYLAEANQAINESMQKLIVQHFSLGSEVAFQKKEVSPTLSAAFWQTGLNVAIMAGILIVVVIFFFFRKIIPSLAVISAAIFDICGALAMMSVFGIPLSLSSIPALLMLVGYSVDTDIMLTTRLLQRREGTPAKRAADSMVTGLTMTGTTLAALAAMIIISYINQVYVIFEIATVIFFGLLADLVSTWLMNAGILLWYLEWKNRKRGVF